LEKIFKTYSKRKEVEKYSHRASLEEIKENDYNLNIPRYVDTFEEEEEIDISEVATNLQNLQKEEKSLQEKIGEFCEELKIDKPF
jgi:type I restriction enzyme M protein